MSGNLPSGGSARLMGLLAAVSLALVVGGGAWTYRQLRPTAPESIEAEEPGAVMGRKKPEEFGFPAYPGAFQFFSMEVNPEEGSASYSIREGTAREVCDFYRPALEQEGWTCTRTAPFTQQPGDPEKTPEARGFRQHWRHDLAARRLILVALDFPQKHSTGQVVLSWSPLTAEEPEPVEEP